MKNPRLKPARLLGGVGALALMLAMASVATTGVARAGVIDTTVNANFTNNPFTFSLGTGSFTFTAIPNTPLGNPPDEVSTSGSGQVTTFFGSVTDFSAGATIDQNNELYSFASYSSPSTIPNSAADDFIGIDFTNASGLHYGYAQVAGTYLINYAYESTPNTTILTAVPEPSTITLMLAGLVGLAYVRRRRPAAPGSHMTAA